MGRVIEAAVSAHRWIVNDLAKGHTQRILEHQKTLPINPTTFDAVRRTEFVQVTSKIAVGAIEAGVMSIAGVALKKSEKLRTVATLTGLAALAIESWDLAKYIFYDYDPSNKTVEVDSKVKPDPFQPGPFLG